MAWQTGGEMEWTDFKSPASTYMLLSFSSIAYSMKMHEISCYTVNFTSFHSVTFVVVRSWYQSSLWFWSRSLTSTSLGTNSLVALPMETRNLWPTAPTSPWPPFSGPWSTRSGTPLLALSRSVHYTWCVFTALSASSNRVRITQLVAKIVITAIFYR